MTTPTARQVLEIEVLSAHEFGLFGDVIEATDAARHFSINDGYAERFHDLANIDVTAGQGRVLVNIFRARPRILPFRLNLLERHPLGSQAFFPLSATPYLVIVASGGASPDVATLRCFRALPGQGVNYARGTWHHPLVGLHDVSDFLVLDRGGEPGEANCDVRMLDDASIWIE
jgi:ureidoglycolate lyase